MSGKTALLLSGAGGRGILQFPMVQAVIESGIQIDAVYGASVGSLHGSLYQQGSFDVARDIWLRISSKEVYKSDIFNPVRMFSDQACIYDSSPLLKLLRKEVSFDKVRANLRPFHIVATNLSTHNPEIRAVDTFGNSEDFLQFLYASASPPAYFPPVKIGDQYYGDGGITSNFNISQSIKDGADTLIVLRPTPLYATGRPKNVLETMGLVISIATEKYLERELSFVEVLNRVTDTTKYRQIKVVYITHENYGISLLDFDYKGLDRKFIMSESYKNAQSVLYKAFN